MSSLLQKTVPQTRETSLAKNLPQQVFLRLVWKEIRQGFPLLAVLLGVELLLHTLMVLGAGNADVREAHLLIMVLMPSLFAVGAGAILISQDKEQRTIGWLNSLPIAARTILRAKFSVGIGGLAIVWLASIVMTLLFDSSSFSNMRKSNEGLPNVIWPLNSIFLLLLGFATAWRWNSVLVALVMILPLAMFPTVVCLIECEIRADLFSLRDFLPDGLVAINYLLAISLSGWFAWRFGDAYLTAKDSDRRWSQRWPSVDFRTLRQSSLPKTTQGLTPTLVWQFAWQNRMIPIAILALIAIPVLAVLLHFSGTKPDDWLFLPSVACWLIASWLGASVFQSDTLQSRIRFMAERGVAPNAIWWTRQIIPASLFALAAMILVLFVWLVPTASISNGPSPSNSIPLIALAVTLVIAFYAAGQWYGQLFRSPIVSLVTVPAAMGLVVGYSFFAVTALGSTIWLLLISLSIAFVATRVMMHPWMDGRTDMRYWLGHAGFLSVAVVLPAVPYLITAATYPSMPGSANREFVSLARSLRGRRVEPMELVFSEPKQLDLPMEDLAMEDLAMGGNELSAATPVAPIVSAEIDKIELGFVDQVKARIETIEIQLSKTSGPLKFSRATHLVAAEAMLTRLNLDETPNDPTFLDRYRKSMQLLDQIVKRMRLSWRLVDQDAADRMECFLLDQVQSKGSRELLGNELYSSIVRSLADRDGRMQSRKRAIVLSWSDAMTSNQPNTLGGFAFPKTTKLSGSLRATLAENRRVSQLAWLLMQYLESKDSSEADRRYAALCVAWGQNASRRRTQACLSLNQLWRVGETWLGDWEARAQELGNH